MTNEEYNLRTLQYSSKSYPEDFDKENGNYFCVCSICQFEFIGHKRRVVCKECLEKDNDDK